MDNILSPEKLTHTWLEDTLALLFGTLMISFGIILFRQAGALTGGNGRYGLSDPLCHPPAVWRGLLRH
ncbi:membrane protein [Klebsiella variicola]|nr:membrane protein [Klebsiella variicola]